MLLISIDILIRLLVPLLKYQFSKAPSNMSGMFPIWNNALGQDKKEKDIKGNKILGESKKKFTMLSKPCSFKFCFEQDKRRQLCTEEKRML